MKRRTVFYFALLTIALTVGVRSATHFERDVIYLYQPDAELRARLTSAEDLSAYIKRLQAAGTSFFASEQKAESLDVVVGVKPGKRVKIWFISSRRSSRERGLNALRKRLETVEPCSVRGGPVVFALNWTIGGAKRAAPTGGSPFPIPQEWRKAGKNLSIPDGVFGHVWRD